MLHFLSTCSGVGRALSRIKQSTHLYLNNVMELINRNFCGYVLFKYFR